jgi:hypothetical protein
MLSNSERTASLKSCLHHAALVIRTALAAILVAQMDFDPSDVIAGMAESALHNTSDPGLQRFIVLDIMVSVYLNLHSAPFIVDVGIIK